MTDYYPLIAKAVAGLEKNTGDQRRALYERARTALVAQVRGLDPPLTESEITRERLALEESIRKVEAEAARKARLETPRIDPVTLAREKPAPPLIPPPSASPARATPLAREPIVRDAAPRDVVPHIRDSAARDTAAELRQAFPPGRDTPPPARELPAAKREPADRPMNDQPPRRSFLPDPRAEAAEPRGPEPESAARTPGRGRARPPPLTDQGLKGFRDVVAEAETLGEATAQAARAAREAYAAVPSDDPDLDHMEPRFEPMGLRSLREPVPARPEPTARMPEERAPARQTDAPRGAESRPPPPRPMGARHVSVLGEEPPQRSPAALGAALFAVLLIVSLAGALYWWREPIKGFFAAVRLPLQGQADQNPTRPKFPDRVGQPGSAEQSASAAGAGKNVLAAVAQKVVLYEEDPADPQGKRFVGTAVWRTETLPGSGQPPELAIRADFEIPERNITATMSIRRNTDQALPATHTIELMFNIPADFPFGGISNVPTILMKQAEQARGAPLAGLVVKVAPTFFLVGLQSDEGEAEHNIQLLKERPWFDIPIVYTNGRRAILAVEKGTPGERAFAEAFKAWGQ
jgi:hypothetical protein